MLKQSRLGMRVAVVLVTSLLVAACGSSSSGGSGNTTQSSANVAATTPATTSTPAAASTPATSTTPQKKVTLLVYSAQGYDANTVKAFQKATGIPTKLVDDSTGPLLARIQAEKANPQWGLLWVDGNEAFAQLDQQGMLEKGISIPTLTAAGQSVTPSDKSFTPTGLTTACTMVYNSSAISSPPTTWQGLLSVAGKVGMNDPAVSGPTYPCVAGLMNVLGGETQGKDFLQKMKAGGMKISQTNGDTLHLLETGQINIALIQSSAAIGEALTKKGYKLAYLPKETLLPGCIGIDSKVSAAEQAEAQKFIDYVLSPAGQHQMQIGDPTGDSLFWPVVPGTAPLKGLPALTSLSTQTVDPYTWGAKEAAINTWFTNNIAQ